MTSAGKGEDPADQLLGQELERAVRTLRGSRPAAAQARYQTAGARGPTRPLRTAGMGVAAALVLVGVASYSAMAGVGPLQRLGVFHGPRPGALRGPSSVPPAASPASQTGLTSESVTLAPTSAPSTQSATRAQARPAGATPASTPSTGSGRTPSPPSTASPTASPRPSPSPTQSPDGGRIWPSNGFPNPDKPRG